MCLLLSILAGYKYLKYFWFERSVHFSEVVVLDIDRGTGTNSIIEQLVEIGLSESAWISRLGLKLFFLGFVLKAGEFEFEGLQTQSEVFNLLHSGVSVQHRVTLIEGKTVEAIVELLQNSQELASSSLEHGSAVSMLSLLSEQALQWMGEQQSAEGWFYPDTYYFSRGDDWQDILKRAHLRLLQALKEEWQERQPGLPYKTPYEALIMASLVERETGAIEEREEIAGVFVRRLQKRMRLQTDPSVIYGLGDSYKGNLTRKHLRQDTPYNTYTRGGLPPTPIAMPSKEAILAAVNPPQSDYVYFVAKGDGSHQFSTTLKQHNAAVKTYILNKKN
mgnify:FL=1